MKKTALFILFVLIMFACKEAEKEKISLDKIAEDYVKVVLRIGQYDADFVDAYYGPEAWKPTPISENSVFQADSFIQDVDGLRYLVDNFDGTNLPEDEQVRLKMLQKQLLAVSTKVQMMGGTSFSFDEEAKRLYDAEPPHYEQSYFDSLLSQLDQNIPGKGGVSRRYNDYAKAFIIPKDRLEDVFRAAITEARIRTDGYFQLPKNENFVLEFVNDKSWSGYNYYQGKSQSLIQINTDFPIFIERAIDLASHEGYPGHHVFNALLEQNLVNGKGWKEFSVYPLFSPQSLIAEGSANYGIDVAFPGEERVKYEKEILFPLAGIDPSKADKYYEIQALRSKLDYAGNEAARLYLNSEISREEAAAWLEKYLLYEPERALQRTRFFDQYRSYVINYNLGRDLVADYVLNNGGTDDQPEKRWAIFKELLSNPHTASTLK
jgi:hypothetical protein